MYRFEIFTIPGLSTTTTIRRTSDQASIPLSQANADCRQFLVDWKAGVEVWNADGSQAPYSDAAVIALGLTPPDDEG